MSKLKDETGNTYGYLTVIERAENDQEGHARWRCKCKCGNEIIVQGKKLRNGNTKSCGCYQRERAAQSNMDRVGSLVGQRFGKLLVLEEAGFVTKASGKRSRIYKCLCDCGNFCEVQHQYLAYGDTTSCGCIRSKGEFQVEQILKSKGIDFKREYSFDDLQDIDKLRFDFAIFKNNKLIKLIEVQGEQHYTTRGLFYKETIAKHDEMKREYCKNHNIPLLEIKYKRQNIIKEEELELEDYFDGN